MMTNKSAIFIIALALFLCYGAQASPSHHSGAGLASHHSHHHETDNHPGVHCEDSNSKLAAGPAHESVLCCALALVGARASADFQPLLYALYSLPEPPALNFGYGFFVNFAGDINHRPPDLFIQHSSLLI
ncbi:MAG: hypothetical protein ACT4NX_10165 [Deltaproteobacteria bacterium]